KILTLIADRFTKAELVDLLILAIKESMESVIDHNPVEGKINRDAQSRMEAELEQIQAVILRHQR
ncbi:MAG TPA: hypothetical protein VMW10_06290, partial [Alphaproteobacteria bacterium]|nr:hypothetical protein [Alphaproteobacteria bacterium]